MLALVPSLLFLLERGDAEPVLPADVLAVAAPDAGELPYLSRVRGEAEGVVRALGHGRVLEARQRDKAALLSDLRSVAAFHFAGHAVANPERPSWSRLVLSPAGEDLLVRDIRERDLRNLRVVTLSACSAGADQSGFGGGGLSLAAAFLRAGATTVVAPLGDIRDDDAPAIMRELYARLARQDPVLALAEMQRAQDEDDPSAALVAFTAAGALWSAQAPPPRP
jgi:CHAT domain-containing protein